MFFFQRILVEMDDLTFDRDGEAQLTVYNGEDSSQPILFNSRSYQDNPFLRDIRSSGNALHIKYDYTTRELEYDHFKLSYRMIENAGE